MGTSTLHPMRINSVFLPLRRWLLLVCGLWIKVQTLSPEKRILMPTREVTCALDLSRPVDEFPRFCDEHPDRTVVVYCNTSAAVKARADKVKRFYERPSDTLEITSK